MTAVMFVLKHLIWVKILRNKINVRRVLFFYCFSKMMELLDFGSHLYVEIVTSKNNARSSFLVKPNQAYRYAIFVEHS